MWTMWSNDIHMVVLLSFVMIQGWASECLDVIKLQMMAEPDLAQDAL